MNLLAALPSLMGVAAVAPPLLYLPSITGGRQPASTKAPMIAKGTSG